MSGNAQGGNDTLIGGDDTFDVNSLYGDAYPCPTTPAAAMTR